MDNKLNAHDGMAPTLSSGGGVQEKCGIVGHYRAECRDGPGGNLIWAEEFDNVVTFVGQNQLLTQITGNTTVVGPFLGLIGNQTTGPVVGDTMASHSGWLEAGSANSPTYSGNRPTLAFNAPSSGNLTTSVSGNFTFTGSGNVTGAFVVFATGATNAVGNVSGVLLSAGNFSAVQPVISPNTLSVNYSIAL